MGVMKLKLLFNDIQFSYKFAQTHLNVGMPSLMRSHARRHRTDIDRIRQTDTDASRLAQFRDSIRNNHTDAHDSGTDDYTHMVDILVRRGGLLDHYTGPRDIKDWAGLKDLKGQVRDLMNSNGILGDGGALKNAKAIWDNPGFQAALSVSKTAYHSAIAEIQATIGDEVTPEVRDAVINEIVSQFNIASVEAFGHQITVDDFKQYMKDVTDGAFDPSDFTMSADGWN